MRKFRIAALGVVAFSALAFNTFNTQWKVDETNYSVKFSTAKFDGIFKGLKTNIVFDENNPSTARIEASIDAESINTGNGLRNKHARQGLETSKYPQIRFVSTSVSGRAGQFETTGKLTIKEVTKEIRFPFQFVRKRTTEGLFTGKFSIKPADYNVKKSGTPEEFTIQLNIPVKQ